MDDAMVSEIRRRMAYEAGRVEPPAGFPKLPDLPLGRYTDPSLYRSEVDRVFRRSWLFAVHASEVRDAGDYRLVDLPFAPVLVVRGQDGQVRAFLNSCRHRGAPVVRSDSGNARLLVCQYHSWSYDLSGRLVRVPDQRDFVGLCVDDRALPEVRCESWGGMIFVNLDDQAPSLLDWLAPIVRRLPEIADAPLRVVDRSSRVVRCNWKIMAEGFLEVYHARTIHSQTVAKLLDGQGAVMELYPHGHNGMVTPYREEVLAVGRGVNLPRIPGMGELFWTSNPAFGLFPNLITPLEASGFPFLLFWPLSIDTTRLDIVWFGVDWGEGDRPIDWDTRLASFAQVMEEDYRNLEPIQRSVECAAHGGNPLNYQERRIWHFHAALDLMIGADRISPDLRVADLLADYVEL